MSERVLVVGMGSIGRRHAENFRLLGCSVAICSSRSHEGWRVFHRLDEALADFQPTHVVIANQTSLHGETLGTVLQHPSAKPLVLVEKPLYAFLPSQAPKQTERVSVAYNMRFHPLTLELQARLLGEPIVGWSAYVGQNLETWRPGRDYRQIYSARRSDGGGALRDLSHEIDVFQFLAGEPDLIAAHGGKFSSLEMDADDQFTLLLKAPRCPHATIHMNCVDRLGQRRLTVHTQQETFELDFVLGTWRDKHGVRVMAADRNESYLNLARAFLSRDPRVCTFAEGWSVGRLIEGAEEWS